MEPNHLTVSQTNWNKPGLFGKLVLWNRPRDVRSQKTHKLIYDLPSVWTKEIKVIIFFPLHRIASNRIVLNWIEIESHCIVIEVNLIASLAASYLSSMYHIVGCASRCVSHRPQLWRCTSLVYTCTYMCVCVCVCVCIKQILTSKSTFCSVYSAVLGVMHYKYVSYVIRLLFSSN